MADETHAAELEKLTAQISSLRDGGTLSEPDVKSLVRTNSNI